MREILRLLLMFFHGAVAVTFICIRQHAWFSQGMTATPSSTFKLLAGRLPAGTAKFEFQRTVLTIARVNRERNAYDARIHLHPSSRYGWSILSQI